MIYREAKYEDLEKLLVLYTFLHDNPMPKIDDGIAKLWDDIIQDTNHHIIIGEEDGQIVSSCVLIVVPNLTHNQRPYALIENVITHPEYQKKGYASGSMDFAKDIAVKAGCYKIMLMTSSKEENTFNFYKGAGYNSDDKTGFVQWFW